MISLLERNQFRLVKQRYRNGSSFATCRMLDNNEAVLRNAPPDATFDREPLRREFDDIGPIRPGTEPTLELGEHKNPVRARVGPIDLREQREWPLRAEQTLGEFQTGALQLLGQRRPLAELEPLSATCEPQGHS